MSTQNKEMIVVRALITFNGRVLVVRRAQGQSRAGHWEIPGGKLDADENLEIGLRREVLEETGIDVEHFKYFSSSRYLVEDTQRLGVVFTSEVSNDEVKLNEESDDYKWIDQSAYDNKDFDEHYQEFFKEYFKTDKNLSQHVNNDDTVTTKYDELIIYTDGGSRGNPGPSASGYVIMDDDKQVLEEGGEYLGITTNNQAEYQAVKLALEKAKRFGKPKINFYIDSLLVVNQMNGVFKIRNRDLWPIHERIKELAEEFESVIYTHVTRDKNKLADAQVNEVLDSHADNGANPEVT